MTTATRRVACVQMDPKLGDVEENLSVILDRLDAAKAAGARLVVFPECALTGYGFQAREEAIRVAEPLPGPSIGRVASACARSGVFAVFGLLERSDDRLFNSVAVVGPGGLVGTYRKVHLPYLGVDRFATPGDRPFGVIDLDGLRVGLLICYDGAFPEAGRVLTLRGADLLIIPTNWPIQSRRTAEVLIACRALENVVYAMGVNRVGEESGFRFCGLSSICDPGGEVIAAAGPEAEETLFADIDPEQARRKKLIRVPGLYEIDRIGDRRPEFYGPISAAKIEAAVGADRPGERVIDGPSA